MSANTSRYVHHDWARREDYFLKLTGGAANTLTVTLGNQYIDTTQGTNGLQRNNVGEWNIYFKNTFKSNNDVYATYMRSGTLSGDEITFYMGSWTSGILNITNRLSTVATEIADGEVIDLHVIANRSSVPRR